MESISKWLLEENHMAYAMAGFIGFFIVLYFLYNAMSFWILKERYHGIRFTTKNIAYITMFTAINVSITVVISLTVPITVFPPIRIAFEGIMVKITGFIFGPIIGVLVALITEVLVMIFVPSFIHPAFIIAVICYGFIAGIGSSFLRLGKGYNWAPMILINLFLIAFAAFMVFIINNYVPEVGQEITILGFKLTNEQYKWIFLGSIIACLVIFWIIYIVLLAKGHSKVLHVLLPIILFATASEYLVTAVISAWGDAGFLGIDGGYSTMFIGRLVQAPLKIIFNSAVLYLTYKAVSPLIKRDR